MSFFNAFVYDPATGAVLRRQNCADVEVALFGPNVVTADPAASENWSDLTHYVVDRVLTERPEMSPVLAATTVSANGFDTVSITGLPPDGVCYVDGVEEIAWTDGQLLFSTSSVGVHRLRLVSFPYRDSTLEITGS